MGVEIQDTIEVWVAWTNTDCTEGRGRQIPRAVCVKEATAIRLGKKGGVQGSDCTVTARIAVKVNDAWLVPGEIKHETKEDASAQKRIDAKRAALGKAKAAGLTEEDLRLIDS